MKYVFATDIHGNKEILRELKDLIIKAKADGVIIGGDIFKYASQAEPQLEFAKEYLYDYFKEINAEIYIIPGNCDRLKAMDYLSGLCEELGINILGLEGVSINNKIKLLGYDHIPPSHFKIKDYERRDMKPDRVSFNYPCLLTNESGELESVNCDFLNNLPSIEEELASLDCEKSIWVMHSPPYGGTLDINYEEVYSGSKAIRKHIERVQPSLSLHGHIHEAPSMSGQWVELIGNTISVNPGTGETLHAVIFDIDSEGNLLKLTHNIFGEYRVS